VGLSVYLANHCQWTGYYIGERSMHHSVNVSGNRNEKGRSARFLSSINTQANPCGRVIRSTLLALTTGTAFMKLGFICRNVPGHINPMTALARHLQLRNHEVVFLYSSGAAGLPFVPSDQEDQLNQYRREVSKMQGEDALQLSVRAVLAQTESILKSLPAVVQANAVDALLIDTVQFYAELGAIQVGVPYIHVSAALNFDYSGYTPLCLYGWPHRATAAALARNREGVARFVDLLTRNNAGIKAYAKAAGLKVDWEDPRFHPFPVGVHYSGS
jgi:UDP:flavonoid glycosyltransferase YjiC (YdhE family)